MGSGVNDTRKQWLNLLQDKKINLIVIEHKDRFTRFGFSAMELLLENENRKIEVINETEDGKEDLMQDFISIITSFCARIYGLSRSKEKLKKIIKELKDEKKS